MSGVARYTRSKKDRASPKKSRDEEENDFDFEFDLVRQLYMK